MFSVGFRTSKGIRMFLNVFVCFPQVFLMFPVFVEFVPYDGAGARNRKKAHATKYLIWKHLFDYVLNLPLTHFPKLQKRGWWQLRLSINETIYKISRFHLIG
jgi:hypothetical protein